MIEPGELHRYFAVREMATGRDVRILGGDTRYEVTGDGYRDYRGAADGEYFLAEPAYYRFPAGRPMRLAEVESLPDGRGLWHPDAWEHWGWLCRDYEGSWRQSAGVPVEHRNLSNDGEFCHSCGKTVIDRRKGQAA